MFRTLLKSRASGSSLLRYASSATPSATGSVTSASAPISTPTLRKLETRWEKMAEDEKDEVISLLAERQKADWKELTPLEKKAAWYVSYGEWGPRRPVHAKGDVQRIVIGTLIGLGAAAATFALIRSFMPEQSKTMSREWQQASNEQLEEINAEPFTGFNQIQSPLRGVSADDEDEDDE